MFPFYRSSHTFLFSVFYKISYNEGSTDLRHDLFEEMNAVFDVETNDFTDGNLKN